MGAAGGADRERLERLADYLESLVGSVEPALVAGLSRELRMVLRELRAQRPLEVSAVDELSSRRRARRAGSG